MQGIKVQVGNKNRFFSADISPKNQFSVSMEKKSAMKNQLQEKSLKNRENRRFFGGKNRCALHAHVRRISSRKIGDLSPINRRFFVDFFGKKSINLSPQIVLCFLSNVQISSAFLKESNGYIFYPTVDFKSKV